MKKPTDITLLKNFKPETTDAHDAASRLSQFFISKKNTPFYRAKKWLFFVVVMLLFAVLVLASLIIIYKKNYTDTFLPGAQLTGITLNGLTMTEANAIISAKTEKVVNEGIKVIYNDQTLTLNTAPLTATPDVGFNLFDINYDLSLRNLFNIGRQGNWLQQLQDRLKLYIWSPNYGVEYFIDEENTKKILQEKFGEFETASQAAAIIFKNGGIDISHEQYGRVFNYNEIIMAIKNRLTQLQTTPIKLSLQTDYPKIYAEQLALILPQAEKLLTFTPINLTISETVPAEQRVWTVSSNELASLITAKKLSSNDSSLSIGLNLDATSEFLAEKISPQIDIEPIEAKFQIVGSKVAEFQSSYPGQKLNTQVSADKLENLLLNAYGKNDSGALEVELIVDEVKSEITNDNVNNLGISDLIGTGHSNFAGSPRNRRHNIAIGAASVNGTLIAPGEEFSLLKTLGTINASTGYLPELVIKGDETVPEYGGGLCQIGTTVFRGTLASGLPVIARRNHSYRVSYYEPAGTDATIYDPAPDYKFLNDTPNYVLIQSRIEGDDLYFDFWGTYDGRIAEQTKPMIFNITYPPAIKLIETDTLPPGEKKCTERAHNGADASFDYKVTYANGTLKEENFFSRYRPWQEVCLIGVDKTASSTPETTGDADSQKIKKD